MKKLLILFSIFMVMGLSSMQAGAIKQDKRVYSTSAIVAMAANDTVFDVVLPLAAYISTAKPAYQAGGHVLSLDGLIASYLVYALGSIAKNKIQAIIDKVTDLSNKSTEKTAEVAQ